ncbi:MAG: hypothetical protein U0X41_08265 [Chitinophagales bacterium]
MKNTNFITSFILLVFIGIVSCKKDTTEKLNPNIEYHKVDTTLKSFFPQPTLSDRFEYVGYIPFEAKGLAVSVVISWESDPDDIQFYVNNADGETLDENGYTKAMNAGITVDSTSENWSTYSTISNDYVANPSLPKGNLAGKGDKYVGFRVYPDSSPNEKYNGWAKINVTANGRTVKIIEYAFNKIANKAIKTGEK